MFLNLMILRNVPLDPGSQDPSFLRVLTKVPTSVHTHLFLYDILSQMEQWKYGIWFLSYITLLVKLHHYTMHLWNLNPYSTGAVDLFKVSMIIGAGVLACATRGGGQSEADHCFHLFFFVFVFFPTPSAFHPLRRISRARKFVSPNILAKLEDKCKKKI